MINKTLLQHIQAHTTSLHMIQDCFAAYLCDLDIIWTKGSNLSLFRTVRKHSEGKAISTTYQRSFRLFALGSTKHAYISIGDVRNSAGSALMQYINRVQWACVVGFNNSSHVESLANFVVVYMTYILRRDIYYISRWLWVFFNTELSGRQKRYA
jgi:hypothetical protein